MTFPMPATTTTVLPTATKNPFELTIKSTIELKWKSKLMIISFKRNV